MIGINQPRFVQAQRRVALTDTPVLTIRLFADGICYIADISVDDARLGVREDSLG
jgi:hypothetical protein